MSLVELLVAVQVTQGALNASIGVATVNRNGDLCFALPGPAVAAGEWVTIVKTTVPQVVEVIEVGHLAPTCEPLERAGIDGPYYAARQELRPVHRDLWVAFRGKPVVRVSEGTARVRLNPAAPAAQLRSCASSEGLHLTVWAERPLRSRRIWHAYYYLGYDVEPSCQEADYQD